MTETAPLEPELRCLLSAAKQAVCQGAAPDKPFTTSVRSIDWERTYRLACRHGVVAQLNAFLDAHPEAEPEADLRASVAGRADTILRRNLQLAGEMHELLGAFESASVRAIPFKGPVVAVTAYDELARRTFADLDFLIPQPDVPRATEVLWGGDYELETYLGPYTVADIPDGPRGTPFPFAGELSFVDDERDLEVELRFSRGSMYGGGSIDIDSLWEERRTVTVAGQDSPALSPTDQLVVLSSHGSKHLWRRLEWVAGLAGVAEQPNADWHDAVARARERETLEELYLGVLLAVRLLDADIPADVVQDARQDGRCETVASEIWRQYAEDPMWTPTKDEEMRLRGQLHGDLYWRYLKKALRPTRGDYALVNLPRPLWPIYRILRMVRGPLRHILKLPNRSSTE